MTNRIRMRTGLWLLVATLLASATLPWGVPVAAAAKPDGSGPDNALTLDTAWHPINPKQSLWYSFYYDGGNSPIQVRLEAQPQGGAKFGVWPPDQAQNWRLGVDADPIGRGSPDANNSAILTWSGSFSIPGMYYVVVEHSGSTPGATYFFLQVSGSGVAVAAPTPKPAPKPTPRPTVPANLQPTGKLVFQTTFGGPFYTINVDGTGLKRITDGIDLAWSPDGKRIAFSRLRDPRGIYVVNADGSNEHRVFDWTMARWSSWSPDGSQILFSRSTGKGRQDQVTFCFFGMCFTFPANPHWRLGLVNVESGSFREPPSTQVTHSPDWSPDAAYVVYDDIPGLRVQTMDTQSSYFVTSDAKDTSPAYAPDGRSIALMRRQHDHWEIYTVGLDGKNPKRLTDTPKKPNGEVGSSVAPAWSPDGNFIAFLTDRTGKWEMWVMRADGSQEKPMFQGQLKGLTLDYGNLSEKAIDWTK